MKHVYTIILIIALLIGVFMVTDKTKKVADAIAHAEGFYADGDPLPRRANNPGDLEMGDVGFGEINGKTVYGSVAAGWAALYKQVGLMISGLSKHYKPSMTILEIATIYTGADSAQSWAATVAQRLGVTVNTTLGSV